MDKSAPASPIFWDTPKHCWHAVRVLCDQAGLLINEKNLICACIYQESRFQNYLPDGAPVRNDNLAQDGSISSSDWGIAQVNDYYHIGRGKDFPSVDYVLGNPDAIVQWMIDMYKRGNLKLWSSFSTGAYKAWLLQSSPMWTLAS